MHSEKMVWENIALQWAFKFEASGLWVLEFSGFRIPWQTWRLTSLWAQDSHETQGKPRAFVGSINKNPLSGFFFCFRSPQKTKKSG